MASSALAPRRTGGAAARPSSWHSRAERIKSATAGLVFSVILFGFILIVAALAALAPAAAAPQNHHPVQPVKVDVSADLSGGFARLVFSFHDEVGASVNSAGNILIISFDRPVYLFVEHLTSQASEYIAAARRDPDGRSVRFALSRKVSVNSIETGEKFFVDLLPQPWEGPAPPLPHEVVEQLALRAREVEHLQHMARLAEQKAKIIPVRVHVASLPTFTRYVFDIAEQTSVSADRAKERLTLSFDSPLVFDLSDVDANLPPVVASINAETEEHSTSVRFSFMAPVDLRTFRDGKGYVVDIVKDDAAAPPRDKSAGKPMIDIEAMPTAPAAAPPASAARTQAHEKLMVAPPPAQEAIPEPPGITPLDADESAPKATEDKPAAEMTPAPDRLDAFAEEKAAAAKMAAEVKASEMQAAAEAKAAADAKAMAEAKVVTEEMAAAKPRSAAGAKAAPEAKSAAEAKPPAEAKAAAEAKLPATPVPAPPPSRLPAVAPSRPAASAPAAEAAASAPRPAQAAGPAPASPRAAGASGQPIAVELLRQGNDLKLSFPFPEPTAAAVFRRADTLWIVFDTKSALDLSALTDEPTRTIRSAEFSRDGDAAVVRIRLDHPHLSSIVGAGPGWELTIGETVADPTRALDITRNLVGQNRASVTVNFEHAHQLHRVSDPDVGDSLWVVTGYAPVRGFIDEHDFVEFQALASTQGVVIAPLADDLHVELSADHIVIGRPGGLTLSSSLQGVLHGTALRPVMFDAEVWGLDRRADFSDRQSQLMAAAAAASAGKRAQLRLDLARFYIAREMYSEAKGVLDVVLAEDRAGSQDVSANVLRAITEIMMNRPDAALKDLANPAIGDQHDAPLWRGMAYADQGKWTMARDSFKQVEAGIAALPVELQRVALKSEMRAAIEVGDFAGASQQFNDIETVGLPYELQPAVSVLVGRLNEGMGRKQEALNAYRTAADSWDRPSAAQGRLREAALRYSLGDLKREDVLSELETLTTIWRGDETEIGALEIMARLYTEEGRYRDSFYVMRSAVAAHPDSDMTRRIQEQAAATFESLFLADKGDALSAIDALALFYDFRELTPIGRRGDEMIRRLADRLVAVDLLDQAADLLQYQVDHRLQGAARAQVATRLAVVYLMNRKPERALAILRGTHAADIANEFHNQRLLLEARALSDLGRHDVALEVVAHVDGRETVRLRADILWAARRWAAAAEQIELYYGDRWKDFEPLKDVERADILRAATGFALGEDTLGLARLHEKYAAKMAQTADARAFEIVSAPLGASGKEFREIARAAVSVDTLEGFLRDVQARYPDASSTPKPSDGAPVSTVAPPSTPGTPDGAPPARAAGKAA
jgi:tetratricopeptide (TPR) repeat protein